MKGMCCDMFWEVLNTSCMVPASGKSIFFRAISPAGLEQGFSGSRFQLWDCDILQDLATIWIPCLVLFAMAIRLESSAPFARHWFTSQPRSSAFFQKYSVRHPPLQPNAKAGSVAKWQAKIFCCGSKKKKTFCEILSFWNPATAILGILDEAKDAKGKSYPCRMKTPRDPEAQRPSLSSG